MKVHHGLAHTRDASINIPNVRLRCFVLNIRMKVFSGLQSVKTKAYEYAIIYMSVPTARHFKSKCRREDITNVGNFNEKQEKERKNSVCWGIEVTKSPAIGALHPLRFACPPRRGTVKKLF